MHLSRLPHLSPTTKPKSKSNPPILNPRTTPKTTTTSTPLRRRRFRRPTLPLISTLFYSTTFALASLLLAALLLITPSDHIYQAFRQNELYHVIIVAGCYILTFGIAVIVYAGRVVRTRGVLVGVGGLNSGLSGSRVRGEGWLRFGDGEWDGIGREGRRRGKRRGKEGMKLGVSVCEDVEGLVRRGWARSARLAFLGRPRELDLGLGVDGSGGGGGGGGEDDGHVHGDLVGANNNNEAGSHELSVLDQKGKKRRIGTGALMGVDAELFGSAIMGGDGNGGEGGDWKPTWGEIRHPGWSWSSKLELKGVQFEAVVVELGGLVEAKAVSLAPLVGGDVDVDEQSNDNDNNDNNDNKDDDDHANEKERNQRQKQQQQQKESEQDTNAKGPPTLPLPPQPDPLIITLLQRPLSMGLRDYITHLTTLGMVHPPSLGQDFLALYERARFSGTATSEDEFETLMRILAELLRDLRPVEGGVVEGLRERAGVDTEDEDEDAWEGEGDVVWDTQERDDEASLNANAADADDANNDNLETQSLTPSTSTSTSNATVNRTPLPPLPPPSSSSSSIRSLSSSKSRHQDVSHLHHHPEHHHDRGNTRPRGRRYASAKSTSSSAVPSPAPSVFEPASGKKAKDGDEGSDGGEGEGEGGEEGDDGGSVIIHHY